MTETLEGIRRLLEAAADRKIRKLDRDGFVWSLRGVSRRVEEMKVRVLRALVGSGVPVLLNYEEEPSAAKGWSQPGPGCWRVPPDAVAEELLEDLYLGNYQFYPGESHIADFPDLVRAGPGTLREILNERDLAYVVDAFHDDDYWVLGMNQATIF